MILDDREIGGGIVRRLFSTTKKTYRAGMKLSREDLLAMPAANRRALIENGFIVTYPIAGSPDGEIIIVNRGFGKYDVVRGHKLNGEPLDKEGAEALADAARAPGREQAA